MAASKIGTSGCGLVIKWVDRERWVTISNIIVDVIFYKCLCAQIVNHCIIRILDDVAMCEMSILQECEPHRKRASLQVGVKCIRNTD